MPSTFSPVYMPHRNHNLNTIRICKGCHVLDGQPCLACQEYLDLDNLHSTEQFDDETMEHQRELRTYINQSHDPITRHFPFEITSAIFQYSLPENRSFGALDQVNNPTITRYSKKYLVCGPLFLGAVCRTWRHIAWTSPQLWTTIRLFLGLGHGEFWSRLDAAREWLDRAGQLPLSILVSWPFHDELHLHRSDTDDRIISLVNRYSSRWNDIEIQGPSWLVALLSGDSRGAPKLCTLRIYPRQGQNFHFSLAGKRARPTDVSIRWGSFKWLDIDWRHTTNVSAEFAMDECVELLRRAPRLTRCRLSVGKKSGSFLLPEQPITHDALQSLEFVFNHHIGTEVTQFLDSFAFPHLTDLKLDQRLELAWDLVIAHLKRSSSQLTSLEIKSHCDYDVLLAILLNTPSLRTLRITDSHPDLFTLFADTAISSVGDAQGPFLPNLESINVWPYRDSIGDGFWDRILSIFGPISKVRNPHLHRRPLNKLQINRFWHPNEGILSIGIDKKIASRIAKLAEAGIVLEVKDWNNKYNLLKLAMLLHNGPQVI